MKKALFALACLLPLSANALVYNAYYDSFGNKVESAVMFCADTPPSMMIIPCPTSSGGGSGGTVVQGAQGSSASPWFVSQTGALPAGSNTIGTVNLGTIAGIATETTVAAVNTATGSKADAAATDSTSSWSVIANLKGIYSRAAAMLAKMPALGTAGTPSTDVISIQGVSGGTPQPVTVSQTTPGTTNGVNITPTTGVGAAITPSVSGSAVSGIILKASAGNLYDAYANCTAACWLMVFNSATVPANGSTTAGAASGNLVECIAISASNQNGVTYPDIPERFSVGISAAISSTACATLTLATTGFIHARVQ